MKFVLVNGWTSRTRSFCALCCKSIGEGYLRGIAAQATAITTATSITAKFPFLHSNIMRWHHDNSPRRLQNVRKFLPGRRPHVTQGGR